jgi:lysozyme family protein
MEDFVMKSFFKNVENKNNDAVSFVKGKINNFAVKFRIRTTQANTLLAAKRAENFVDSGIKILIAVVIGALLLGGLYALFGDTIMPTVTEKVEEMFEFNG